MRLVQFRKSAKAGTSTDWTQVQIQGRIYVCAGCALLREPSQSAALLGFEGDFRLGSMLSTSTPGIMLRSISTKSEVARYRSGM